MIDVKEANESQYLFPIYPHDILTRAVDDFIQAQDELSETITKIYQWAAAYDSRQSAIKLPEAK
ncbi:MAG: hypothetical protein JSW16_06420 [Dehalococcoidales bacterium]|nr:MAG: hypothetical protein JSW16_06420 [Dehalococcoidales bacterium]